MFSGILQITIMSIILIFLVHHLFTFFKTNLTVPKIKDLVNSPVQKYEDMFNVIKSSNTHMNTHMNAHMNAHTDDSNYSTNISDLLPSNNDNDPEHMKNELKSFLKGLSTGASPSAKPTPTSLGCEC